MSQPNAPDATRGQGLRSRVETRKRELQAVLAGVGIDAHRRADVEGALSAIEGLLTGDLDAIPNVVAAQLNYWLETNKHLAEPAPR